ncbi:hypothetical protein K493DRAFT_302990 [Basidiobolus meristosporus CBS 931.73]|uniref:Uncharacterized protein n=1 Tax=Basidiobolus meristosporus CBS 931.73 TaxID=1314790 RepID=A0A1Y1Y4W3_9FUNG|nr:hypothetical protein K493DRAFT_302990 [Basidiobolus meristosporus CBS 931.73]|eukprot:ORX92979.1 hypothetical protein K493DRAFT_302990 [Basidiobolus meristosporus CBS 931.73]
MVSRLSKSYPLPSPSSISENPSSLSSTIFDSPQPMPSLHHKGCSNRKVISGPREASGILNSTQQTALPQFSASMEENEFDSDCTAISDHEGNHLIAHDKHHNAELSENNNNATLDEAEKAKKSDTQEEKEILSSKVALDYSLYSEESDKFPSTDIRHLKSRVREFDAVCSDMLCTTLVYHEKCKQLTLEFSEHQQDLFDGIMTRSKEMTAEICEAISEEILKAVVRKVDSMEAKVEQQLNIEVTRMQQNITNVSEQVGQVINCLKELEKKCGSVLSAQLTNQESLNELCKK